MTLRSKARIKFQRAVPIPEIEAEDIEYMNHIPDTDMIVVAEKQKAIIMKDDEILHELLDLA